MAKLGYGIAIWGSLSLFLAKAAFPSTFPLLGLPFWVWVSIAIGGGVALSLSSGSCRRTPHIYGEGDAEIRFSVHGDGIVFLPEWANLRKRQDVASTCREFVAVIAQDASSTYRRIRPIAKLEVRPLDSTAGGDADGRVQFDLHVQHGILAIVDSRLLQETSGKELRARLESAIAAPGNRTPLWLPIVFDGKARGVLLEPGYGDGDYECSSVNRGQTWPLAVVFLGDGCEGDR